VAPKYYACLLVNQVQLCFFLGQVVVRSSPRRPWAWQEGEKTMQQVKLHAQAIYLWAKKWLLKRNSHPYMEKLKVIFICD
jgi:hypothetical protein